MQGHAAMDVSVTEGGTLLWRVGSPKGCTAISHSFVMDWAAIYKDIFGGLLIAGALAARVPNGFWQSFFLGYHPLFAKVWGPLIGPLVASVSFVCFIGNVPLAAVLWNGGISFGGVVSFISPISSCCRSVLNIVFLMVPAVLLWRFFSTRGLGMLRMMKRPMPEDWQGTGAHNAHGWARSRLW
jgi:hypothetical protein